MPRREYAFRDAERADLLPHVASQHGGVVVFDDRSHEVV
jgi:hypothetical protein